jgi:putative ABC transport system ATP-binding protein
MNGVENAVITGPLVMVDGLGKSYLGAGGRAQILRDVSLSIVAGEFAAIMGPSGSGKSTLLQLLGCLDVPTDGEYWFDGTRVDRLTDPELAALRNREIGFVFQSFKLLPRLTVLQNVELPLIYGGVPRREREGRVQSLLDDLGLGAKSRALPTELSGGQQQLVAIARALALSPRLLLADEPTGNLDTSTGARVLDIIEGLHRSGMTVLLVTHDAGVAARSSRIFRMRDGTVEH